MHVRALHAIVQKAIQERVDLFVANGDVLEEVLFFESPDAIPRAVYAHQCKIMGAAFRLFCRESGKPITVVTGNHDLVLKERKLHRRFNPENDSNLRFDLRPEPIFQPHNDVVITHGHLFHQHSHARLAVDELLRKQVPPEDSLALLNAIHPINPVHAVQAAENNLHAVRALWEKRRMKWGNSRDSAEGHRSVADRIILFAAQMRLLPMVDGWVGPRSYGLLKSFEQWLHETFHELSLMQHASKKLSKMTDGVAHLTQLLGAKVGIVGHDHQQALVQRHVFDPRTGKRERVIVANSGHWVGRLSPMGATYVDTDQKTVSVLEYQPKKGLVDIIPPKQY